MYIPQLPCASAFLPKRVQNLIFFGSICPSALAVTPRCHPEHSTLNLGGSVFFGHLEKGFGVGLGLDYLQQRTELQSHLLCSWCPSVLLWGSWLDNPMGWRPGCLLQGPFPSFLGVPYPVPRIWLCQGAKAHGRSIQRLIIPINHKLYSWNCQGSELRVGWINLTRRFVFLPCSLFVSSFPCTLM